MAKNLIYLAAAIFVIGIVFKVGNIMVFESIKASTFLKAAQLCLLFSIAFSLANKKS